MTAAKIMDIISRLPGCDGQAADAVSAYTQVKMEDAHKLFKIPKSECPDIWIRLPRHKWPKSGPAWKTQSFLLKGICTIILWQDLWERQFEKILSETWPWTSLVCVSSPKCVYMCVRRCPSQTPNAFICVSPNAYICVYATEFVSLAYLCSLRSHVF